MESEGLDETLSLCSSVQITFLRSLVVSFILFVCKIFKGSASTFRDDNSVSFIFLASDNVSIVKGKNLLPVGTNSFL